MGLLWDTTDTTFLGKKGTVAFSNTGAHVVYAESGSSATQSADVALWAAAQTDPPSQVATWPATEADYSANALVAGANTADRFAVQLVTDGAATGPWTPTLRVYTSSSTTPDIDFDYAHNPSLASNHGVHISADGDDVVAWCWNPSAGTARLTCFLGGTTDDTAPDVGVNLSTNGSPIASALSSDGTKLLLTSTIRRMLVDTTDGSIDYNELNFWVPQPLAAINSDGTRFVLVREDRYVDVYDGSGGTYTMTQAYDSGAGNLIQAMDANDDCDIIGLGINVAENPTWLTHKVVVLNDASGSWAVTGTYTHTGTGTLDTNITDLSMDVNGETLAVSTWGDELGTTPTFVQLRPVTASGRWYVWDSHTATGSAMGAAVAHNGVFAVTAGQDDHASTVGGDALVNCYRGGAWSAILP